MKNIFKSTLFVAAMITAAAFSACSDKNDPAPDPTPDPPEPGTKQVVFTSASEAVYRGDVNANQLGLYTLTLEVEGHKLHLEFTSSLSAASKPVPDAAKYDLSSENGLSTFNGQNSYWLSSANGTEVTRRFASGSFTFSTTAAGYKVTGVLTGRDETELDFVYEGALDFLDFNGNPVEDAIKCLSARGTYYGLYYIPNAADYYIVLFDTVHQNSGDPYNYRICLDFTSARPSGGSIMPALGTYRVDREGTFGEGTFVAGMLNGANGTLWQVPNGDQATRYMVQDGFFTIRTADNGKYQIFGTLKDMYNKEISFDYTGALPFDNDAVGTFTSLTTDFALGEAFYANQKCDDSDYEDYDLWKIYFYDEAGWTSKGKEGHFVTFNIPLAKGAKSIPAGEYTPADHVLFPEAGNYVPGYVFAYDTAMATAYGSWLAKGKGDYSAIWAPIRGGTLKLVENADKTFTATFDVLDDDYIPKHITGSFTGEIPVLTPTAQAAALAVPATSRRTR